MDPRVIDDSPVLWAGRPAWSHFIFLWIFVAIMAIRGMVAFRTGFLSTGLFHVLAILVLSGIAVFLRQTARYAVTRKAVYRSKGFLGEQFQSFPVPSLASVEEHRGPLDRLLGTGDLVLSFSDGTRERLTGIKHPDLVARKIRALL
jgi:membrane protein YdbS with pleckstrin-like domain